MIYKVSIIVPIFNSSKYLEKCINSLLSQTYQNFEILLIDDGSTDDSLNICRKFEDWDNRIRVFHQCNQGVSTARNLGLSEAKGEYIAFCDSDDWFEKDMLEYLLSLIEQAKYSISSCNVFLEYKGGKTKRKYQIDKNLEFDSKNALVELHKGNIIQHWLCNKLFNRKLFENLSFSKELAYGEDYNVLCELLEKSNGIICGKECKYHYLQRADSACNNKFTYAQFLSLKMYEAHAIYYGDIIEKEKNIFWAHYILEVMAVLTSMIKGDNVDKEILDQLRYTIKRNLWRYVKTRKVPFYLKMSAIIICVNFKMFRWIYTRCQEGLI